MKVWPLTSTSVAPVSLAAADVICFVSCSVSAVFRILHLTYLFLVSCLLISFINSGEAPLLPIQIVGFSSPNFLLINLLFPGVISLMFLSSHVFLLWVFLFFHRILGRLSSCAVLSSVAVALYSSCLAR
jgi:hypothetical protein